MGEGVQQIMSGDFSKLQDLGKKVLGEDGSQVVRTILDNIPEGTFGSQDDAGGGRQPGGADHPRQHSRGNVRQSRRRWGRTAARWCGPSSTTFPRERSAVKTT